ncbi:hypothetical protein ASD80_02060 [Devosia sp. Root635]|nr:hypothetical protein ASD80_02060 [Devosia sp. Root635]
MAAAIALMNVARTTVLRRMRLVMRSSLLWEDDRVVVGGGTIRFAHRLINYAYWDAVSPW